MAPELTTSAKLKVLVAEDQPVERRLLTRFLERWGYEPVPCPDGQQAWDLVERGEAPHLMVLDWSMPGMDGVDVCRKLRERDDGETPYVLVLTARNDPEDQKIALEAGANDFVSKPFDPVVLEARVRNAARTLELQERLADRVSALEVALGNVKKLQGLLPICSYCKAVRSDENYWSQVEAYLAEYSEVRFTHSICPACYEKHVEPQLEQIEAEFDEEEA